VAELQAAAAETTAQGQAALNMPYEHRIGLNLVGLVARKAHRSSEAAVRYDVTGEAQRILADEIAALDASFEKLAAAVHATTTNGVPKPLSQLEVEVKAAAVKFRDRVDQAWLGASEVLERLLATRLQGLWWTFALVIGFMVVGCPLALGITAAVSAGLTARFRGTIEAMQRLRRNDLAAEIPYLTDRNETGEIAQALAALRERLAERNRLEAEAAGAHGRLARLLSSGHLPLPGERRHGPDLRQRQHPRVAGLRARGLPEGSGVLAQPRPSRGPGEHGERAGGAVRQGRVRGRVPLPPQRRHLLLDQRHATAGAG
jgi:hypothetical protein